MTTLQKFAPLIACFIGNLTLFILTYNETGKIKISEPHFVGIVPAIMVVVMFIRNYRKERLSK